MSIDASWGNGKTTFLNMWKQHLRNEGFPVVGFNAWNTDFAEYPLIALTSELLNTLRPFDDNGDLGLDAIETTLPRLLKAHPHESSSHGRFRLAGGVVSIQTSDPSVALIAANALAAGVAGDHGGGCQRMNLSENLPEPLHLHQSKRRNQLVQQRPSKYRRKIVEKTRRQPTRHRHR